MNHSNGASTFVGCPPLSLLCAVAVLAVGFAATAEGETFAFGLGANNLVGATSKTLDLGGFAMDIVAGPAGSGLWESGGPEGMGVDSTAILGSGGQAARFDRINGTSEFIEISFDSPGTLTGINFDGVKDESLEYFILESWGGLHINFFDSAANITIPGAVDNAVLHGAVTGQVVYLLEGGGFDDEAIDLFASFTAGQVFTLTYAEVGGGLGEAFEPIIAPNGARLQGITIAAVPEPASLAVATVGALICLGVAFIRGRATVRSVERSPDASP